MIVDKVHIQKFRGFKEESFSLGKNITVIAGQNGTQKTTLLGMLSQPFAISKDSPMFSEKPLSGDNYRSLFAQKFRFSQNFDKPKNHEWTLIFSNIFNNINFTVESIPRDKNSIRFWQKGTKEAGSGYTTLPVIYLSLKRLLPIGEDGNLKSTSEVTFLKEEIEFYEKWHNKILIIPNSDLNQADYLSSSDKKTIGMNTPYYDWSSNSAGQDNLGKILLAVLSFKRLKEKYPDEYKGGILVVDEIDATLYPGSQIELLKALRKFSSQYNIQIIFTTHSLSLLKESCKLSFEENLKGQIRVIYLIKKDEQIKILEDISYETIKNRLNVSISEEKKNKKLNVYTEDKEAIIFIKAILKAKTKYLNFIDIPLGRNNLIELVKKKIPSFQFPQSIVILDGDIDRRKVSRLTNIVTLPGGHSPERLIADYLYNLGDSNELWENINTDYNKQFLFRNIGYEEVKKDREKAKEWFNNNKKVWGRNALKVINPWIKENQDEVKEFISQVDSLINKFNELEN